MIYLDYAATTPVDPAVLAEMMPLFSQDFGNASSAHERGRRAEQRVGQARRQVGELLGATTSRVVFTSGATESLNTAIKGVAAARPRQRLIVGATEHKAAMEAVAAAAAQSGCELVVAPVLEDGVVDLDALARFAMNGPTAAVIVMAANNETGAMNPVGEVAALARQAGAFSIVDATQQAGRAPVLVEDWGVDFCAVSAHKIYGPQGVGALVVPSQMPEGFERLMAGGDNERGWRSGTTNLPGTVGFGMAAELALHGLSDTSVREAGRRLEERLLDVMPDCEVHSSGAPRLPGFVNLRIPGADADAMVATTPHVAFATGSACSASVPSPSHVLLAMGVRREHADQSVRFTAGRFTTVDEVDQAVKLVRRSAQRLRALEGVGV